MVKWEAMKVTEVEENRKEELESHEQKSKTVRSTFQTEFSGSYGDSEGDGKPGKKSS